MKKLKTLKIFSAWLIFSFCFQTLYLPLLQAQGRGIFLREDASNDDDATGKSFRTLKNPNTNAQGTSTGLPGNLPSGTAAAAGLEGMGAQGSTAAGSSGSSSALSGMVGGGGIIYQIHVLGEVLKPGTYRVPASTRVSEALQMAGGIKKDGSERNIEIRHPGGGPTKVIDLMSYKILGQLQDNPYLMDNEVIFVPLKKKVIEIEGALLRPGIYELRSEKSLKDVIKLAGGFSQGFAPNEPIRVIRYNQNETKDVIEVQDNAQDLSNFQVLNGDVVVIPHMFTKDNKFDYNLKKLPNDNLFYPSYEDRVFVIGAVEVPGAYNFNQYYKLGNYLALAGGATRMAKGKIKIVTPDGKEKRVRPDSQELINPGDTIYVPEKFFSRETWVSVVTSLLSLGLSATSTAVVLSRP